jgi:ribosomal protein L15
MHARRHRREMTVLQLQTLSEWIAQGKLNPTSKITMKELLDSGAVHGVKEGGVKLLGNVSTLSLRPSVALLLLLIVLTA